MADKIKCPHCRKMNEIHKFCVYCGKRLPIDDDQIKLMKDNPDASCLNCGRPAKRGQTICRCGYEFRDIKCPQCGTMNEYANRFCISCGEKLWRLDVYDYIYDESHFEAHLFNKLPGKLRNITVSKRYESFLKPTPGNTRYTGNLQSFQSSVINADKALSEIRSRWKVVSPNYCIKCLGTIRPDAYACPKCGHDFTGDKRRVEQLRSQSSYAEPAFDLPDLKFTYISSDNHLGSLAPSIGESQFEYRERLKWEFAETNIYKNNIKKALDMELASSRVVKTEPPERKTSNGGYCDLRCRHCYEELLDSGGGIVGDFVDDGIVDYYCALGHPLSYGSFCEYYEE